MRIAVFIKSTTFAPNYGGLETQNRTLCEGLAARGYDITVFTPNRTNKDLEEKELNGVKYVFIPSSYRYFLASMNRNSWERKSVEAFRKYHTESPFDLVISQSSAGIGIIKNKEELGVKTISIAHGTASGELITQLQNVRNVKDLYWAVRNLQYFIRQFFGRQREYISKANRVVAVSNAVKKQLLDETFVPEENVRVIHNGIDPRRFESYIRDTMEVSSSANSSNGSSNTEFSNPVKIIYLGRIVRSKGIFELAKILMDFSHENFLYEVVGDGEDLDSYKEYLDELHISKKTKLYGKTSYEDAMKILFNSDIFVLPSKRAEGFPMTLPEAMFASLPVVATSMGGIPDAIEDGKTGFLINPGAWGTMKEKLMLLLKNANIREEMGRNGRIKAEKEFTLDSMLNKYESLFLEILR